MKQTKKILTAIIAVFIVIVMCGCSTDKSLYNTALKQGLNQNSTATLPADGKDGLDGKDGKDGDTLDLYKIYQTLIELGEFSGTYSDFIKEYFPSELSTLSINKSLKNVVSIFSGFTTEINVRVSANSYETYTQKYFTAGSGIIYRVNKDSGDAIIVTNYHVIFNADSNEQISNDVNVFIYGKEQMAVTSTNPIEDIYGNKYTSQELTSNYSIKAKVLGGAINYDIAVLKITDSDIIKNSEAKQTNFAISDDITVGEKSYAIGNASGMGISTTAGIVSVDSEYISMLGADNATTCTFRVIRTDTAVNPGNSGGGLFNTNGELIGLVNAKIASSKIENIGYAIPSNIVDAVAKSIIHYCDGEEDLTMFRCLLGINVTSTTSSAVYDSVTGKATIVEEVSISNVALSSPASGTLEVGDIITKAKITKSTGKIIEKYTTRTFHLVDLSLYLYAGDTIEISITKQDGTVVTFSHTFTNLELTEIK